MYYDFLSLSLSHTHTSHSNTSSTRVEAFFSSCTSACGILVPGTEPEPRQGGLPWWLNGKESACQCRSWRRLGFDSWVGKIHWKRKRQLIPVFLPGKFNGQRSLVGYSPKSWLQRVGHDWATEHPRTVKVRSEVLNHWTTREFPTVGVFGLFTEAFQVPRTMFGTDTR